MQIKIPIEYPHDILFDLHDTAGNRIDYHVYVFEIYIRNGNRLGKGIELPYMIENRKIRITLPPLARGHYELIIGGKRENQIYFFDGIDLEIEGWSDNPSSRNYGDDL